MLVALAACGRPRPPIQTQSTQDLATVRPPEMDPAFVAIFNDYAGKKINADSAAKLFLDYVKAHKATSLNVQMDAPLQEAIVREQERRAKQ